MFFLVHISPVSEMAFSAVMLLHITILWFWGYFNYFCSLSPSSVSLCLGVVNSLFYCPPLSMLFSASVDCTFRCWNVEKGDVVECIHTEKTRPPLCIGSNRKGDTFFSFSNQGVDFWTIRALYTLHCELKGDEGAPLRQILVSPFPAPYPKRVLCLSGESNITLVAAETGTVLTYFKAKQRILCADYCLQKEILLALTETGTVLQANTLTNPITLMQEWEGRGQGPWRQRDNVTKHDAQKMPIPGQACCLVLYSCLAETQAALEEWRSLQETGGCIHRRKAALDDAKNKWAILLLSGNIICVQLFLFQQIWLYFCAWGQVFNHSRPKWRLCECCEDAWWEGLIPYCSTPWPESHRSTGVPWKWLPALRRYFLTFLTLSPLNSCQCYITAFPQFPQVRTWTWWCGGLALMSRSVSASSWAFTVTSL